MGIRRFHFDALVLPLVMLLALACGGGGGASPAPVVPPVIVSPAVTTQPADQTVLAGTTVTFSVAASGTPVFTYRWERSANGGQWQAMVGATQAQLMFTAQATDTGSRFRAVVSNSSGNAISEAAVLTVQTVPVFTAQPLAQTVLAGAVVTFQAMASGNPSPALQWQRSADGVLWTPLTGETSAQLAFTAQPSDDGSQFRASAGNGVGSAAVSDVARLSVHYAPSLASQPRSQSVIAGSMVTFTTVASGNPAPILQWERSFDGLLWLAIGGETRESYTLPATQGLDDGSQFRVVASNSVSSITSQSATLTVQTALPAGMVRVRGVLSLPTSTSDTPADYVVYNPLQSVMPQLDGTFDIAIAEHDWTVTYAVHKSAKRIYAVVTANGADPLLIDSGSTARALVHMNAVLVPQNREDQSRIFSLICSDEAVANLSVVLETVFASAEDPLADPRLLESARDAALSILTTLRTEAASASPALRNEKAPLAAATAPLSSMRILNMDMAALNIKASSGNNFMIEPAEVGIGGFRTNVDWVVKIIELDPLKVRWVGNNPQLPQSPSNPEDIDALRLVGGFEKKVLVNGSVADGGLNYFIDPLGHALEELGEVIFPSVGITLPHDGIYAVVALSGSRFGDDAEYVSVRGWQRTLWDEAMSINIINAALDVIGVGVTIGSFGTVNQEDFKSVVKATYPLILNKVQLSDNHGATFFAECAGLAAGEFIDFLQPKNILRKDFLGNFSDRGIRSMLGFGLSTVTSVFDVFSGSVSASSRILNWGFNVTPKEVAYLVVSPPLDQTAPSIPTGLSASLTSLNRVSLAWTPAVDDVNVAGYRVYRNDLFLANTTATTWIDSITGDARQYCYKVAAFDGTNNISAPSAPRCPSPGIAPVPPESLTATAQTSGTILLSWVDRSDNESGYLIERKIGATGTFVQIAAPSAIAGTGATGSYLDRNLVLDETYCYRLRAFNDFGQTPYSAEACAVAQSSSVAKPSAFTLTAAPAACEQNSPVVRLSWTPSANVTTYDIYRNGALYKVSATIGTTFINMANLNPGEHYTYQVMARNLNGSTGSTIVEVIIPVDVCTAALPTVPTGTTPGEVTPPGPTLASTTVTLGWAQVPRATTYNVTVRDVSTGALVTDAKLPGLTYSIALDAGKAYRWSVAAGNSAGFSAFSDRLYFQTPGQSSPAAPTGLAPGAPISPGTTITTLTPTLTWGQVTGATGYSVVLIQSVSRAVIMAKSVASMSILCPVLETGVPYAWSVSATNASGTSASATTQFFTVTQAAVPPVPTGLSPAGASSPGATVATLTPTLTWNPASGATSYGVVILNAASGATVLTQSVASPALTCPTLQNGVTYAWSVSASNAAGTSAAATLQFFTVTQAAVPPVPTGLSPAGASSPGATVATLTPTLTWNPASGATSYGVVILNAASGATVLTQSVASPALTCPTLQNGVTYAWSVSASNAAGTSAAATLQFFTVTQAAVPPVPTGLSPAGASSPGATVATLTPTLTWNPASGATSYGVVILNAASGATVLTQSVASPALTCPTLQNGVTYAWSVSASNAAGTSAAATLQFFTVTQAAVPPVPTGLSPAGASSPGATVATLTPTLTWNPASGATSYGVVILNAASGATVLTQSVASPALTCPTLQNGVTYAWSVSASNAAGTSAAATLQFFTVTQAAVPPVPTGLSPAGASSPGATVATLTPTLTWNPASGATSYGVVILNAASGATVLTQSVASPALTCPTLQNGVTYAWSVSASNAAGTSAAATLQFFTVTQAAVPPVPTGVSPGSSSSPGTTVTTLTPTLTWNVATGATSYSVVVLNASTGSTVLTQTVSSPALTCSTLQSGVTYLWNVSASNTAGSSLASPGVYFNVQVTPPAPSISGLNPNPVPRSASATTLVIYGSNFVTGSTVVLNDLVYGGGPYVKTPTYNSSGQLTISANFTTTASTWSVQVVNPGGVVKSTTFNFQVQ